MPAIVFVDRDMQEAESVELASGSAVVFSAKSPVGEGGNQDGAALIPLSAGRGVLAVADGVGGLPSGDRASLVALRTLRREVERVEDTEVDLRHAILDGFEKANRKVAELGVGAATTLVVAEIQGATLRPYHAGDSMLVVVGQRGKRKLQTVPHSPVGYAVEAGLLDEGEAMDHAERHLISNALGADDMRVEIGSPLELAVRDTVLLASDGLLDNLHPDEIVETLRKGPLERAGHTLAAVARRRMTDPEEGQPSKPDDCTFVAFRRRPRGAT